MDKAINLAGKNFGKLTVLCREPKQHKNAWWRCRCDCGKETVVVGAALRSGKTKSCGCLAGFKGKSPKSHGHSYPKSPTYNTWNNFANRNCEVIPEWSNFENFLADMGERPHGLFLCHDDPEKPLGPFNSHWGLPTRKGYKRVEPLLADAILAEFNVPIELEYRFHPIRKWRLDLALIDLKLGIEIDGHRFHSSAKNHRNDCEKGNTLTCMGWQLLRYPADCVFNPRRRERIVAQIGRFICGIPFCEEDCDVLTGKL